MSQISNSISRSQDQYQWPIDDDFGHWLAGFVDGEGSFILPLRRTRSGNYGFRGRPDFRISLRQDDELILREIQIRLGCGMVSRKMNRGHGMCTFEVFTIGDCHNVIVPFFRKYRLRAKKARDFEIWSEAVELCHDVFQSWLNRSHLGRMTPKRAWTEEHVDRYAELKRQIESTRKFDMSIVVNSSPFEKKR